MEAAAQAEEEGQSAAAVAAAPAEPAGAVAALAAAPPQPGGQIPAWEIHYLIAAFLERGPCTEAAATLKRELAAHNLLPTRVHSYA